MALLPGFIVVFVLVRTCKPMGVDSTTIADLNPQQPLKCPGVCLEEHACTTTLNETDCANDQVCCVDHFENISTTEFADWDFTTQETLRIDSTSDVEAEGEESTEGEYVHSTEAEADEGEYTYVYSEESEDFVMDPAEDKSSEPVEEGCPGDCVPTELSSSCEYIISSEIVCPSGLTCCLTETEVEKTRDRYNYEVEDSRAVVKREAGFSISSEGCPGTCVHPSHAMFCEEILHQFPCPLNAKCCLKRSMEGALPTSATECTGQCLPSNMYGYCFPPNELVMGPTTCGRGTACCMKLSFENFVRPPSLNGMQFPNLGPEIPNVDGSQILGHLAVDEAGTVFKVSTNGIIFPLPRLRQIDHVRNKYRKLTAYPRYDGDIAIYSDDAGGLYQQFYPRREALVASGSQPKQRPQPPMNRKPIYQFESQASEHAANFQKNAATPEDEVPADEALEDIIIPDDDDEPPITTSKPVVHDEENSRPPCPGSCMSYFLRFTCFRGYAIYDGFTCPGRSVCCARLKDIEDHEQYLKSLSPYFNVPAASRDSSLSRCGLKGRRDTPRVIGGKESLPGEWCWQVAIINVQNQYICGGALIDNSWVLTAAHCVVGPMRENQALFVRAGVTDLKSPEDNSRGQTIRVLSTFIHHNFNSMNLDNNIALLRLQKPAELDANACVICLPTSGQMPKDDTKCTVTGYGFISQDGDMSLKIREAQVPIIDDMDCMANVTEALTNPFILPASSFCAGGQGQQDACQGDAGGPLACEVGGYHELAGLVSWGLGCGRNDVPSIYIKVPSFMGWINQIISSSSFLMSLN